MVNIMCDELGWETWEAHWLPYRMVSDGYCTDCEKIVDIEHYNIYIGVIPPNKCAECGGNNVEFLTDALVYLVEKVEELKQQND